MNIFGTEVSQTMAGVILGIGIVAALLIFLAWLQSLLYICPPNQIFIFSGRRHRMPDGSLRGFYVVVGGRGWKVPFIEKVSKMSLSLMEVPISIRGAYSRGGVALNVDAIANVKISSDPAVVPNAVERFLNQDPEQIRRVAKETLEGHLRGVLSRLAPEEVNEDRLKFAQELTTESEEDLSKLGIHLDTLKIQHVSDDVRYLDSIGRKATATVVMNAEMAESDAKREAEQMESEQAGRASVAASNVDANIAQMQNELRKIKADLEAKVRSEEERTSAAAREARAFAEQELQSIRAELAAIRLQSDTVLPAEADLLAQEFRAKGESAIIAERGRAVGQALDELKQAWIEAGDSALRIYLIEDLENILATAAEGVGRIKIENLKMIDNGSGEVLANYVASYPAMLGSIFTAISDTTGINIPKIISEGSSQKVEVN